jgi:tetratricopeptide (TPR) repeat protein
MVPLSRPALFAAVLTTAWLPGVSSAVAQTQQDWTLCLTGDLRTPDIPIDGCTAVIQSGRQVLQNLARAYNNRGVAYRVKGKYAEALNDFNEAIRLVPDYGTAFNNRGVAYRNIGDLDRAVADYDQAIRLKPDYVAAFYNRGLALTDKHQYERAIADFTTVLKTDPHNPIALYRRGTAYLSTGNVAAGNADLAEARTIKPDIAEDIARSGP